MSFKRIILSAVLVLASAFFIAPNAWAQTKPIEEQSVVLPKNQTVNGDYLNAGNNVDIAGNVNGDVFVAGGNVTVEGTVNGDLLSAGGNINVQGNVTGNIRTVGGNLIISGNVGKNLSFIGGTVNLTAAAKIGGSVTGAGGTVNMYSPVGRDVRLAGGQIVLADQIGGNVMASAGQLTVTSNAKITGNFDYWSNQKANILTGAQILGQTVQKELPKTNAPKIDTTKISGMITGFVIYSKIISFLAAFLIGILLVIFFPIYIQKIVDTAKKSFWPSLGIGIIAIIVTPIVLVLILATLVGIPLAIFAGMLFAYTLYVSKVIVAITIGEWSLSFLSKKSHMIWALFVGLVIYEVLSLIPIIGWLFAIVVVAAGFGAIIMERQHSYTMLREKKLI